MALYNQHVCPVDNWYSVHHTSYISFLHTTYIIMSCNLVICHCHHHHLSQFSCLWHAHTQFILLFCYIWSLVLFHFRSVNERHINKLSKTKRMNTDLQYDLTIVIVLNSHSVSEWLTTPVHPGSISVKLRLISTSRATIWSYSGLPNQIRPGCDSTTWHSKKIFNYCTVI